MQLISYLTSVCSWICTSLQLNFYITSLSHHFSHEFLRHSVPGEGSTITLDKMLPFNPSPFRTFRPNNLRSPFNHFNTFTTAVPSETEIENIILRQQILLAHNGLCPLHSHFQASSISRSPFALPNEPGFSFTPSDRYMHPLASLHICLQVLITTPCSNGTLHIRDKFTATIPLSATIEGVYNYLIRELDRSFQNSSVQQSPPMQVEIKVYYFDGRWERLALFRDVLELRAERGVEGCVVVAEW